MAGGKARPCPGQDDDSDVLVLLGLSEGLVQLVEQMPALGVSDAFSLMGFPPNL